MHRALLVGSPESQNSFMDRVDRHGGLAGLAVADDQLALTTADRSSSSIAMWFCSGSGHHRGRLEFECAPALGRDLAEGVDGLGQRVDDPPEEPVADGYRRHLAGAVDLLALLDARELAEDDDARCRGRRGFSARPKVPSSNPQLVGHDRGQALDPGDAVARLADPADLFAGGGAES